MKTKYLAGSNFQVRSRCDAACSQPDFYLLYTQMAHTKSVIII